MNSKNLVQRISNFSFVVIENGIYYSGLHYLNKLYEGDFSAKQYVLLLAIGSYTLFDSVARLVANVPFYKFGEYYDGFIKQEEEKKKNDKLNKKVELNKLESITFKEDQKIKIEEILKQTISK